MKIFASASSSSSMFLAASLYLATGSVHAFVPLSQPPPAGSPCTQNTFPVKEGFALKSLKSNYLDNLSSSASSADSDPANVVTANREPVTARPQDDREYGSFDQRRRDNAYQQQPQDFSITGRVYREFQVDDEPAIMLERHQEKEILVDEIVDDVVDDIVDQVVDDVVDNVVDEAVDHAMDNAMEHVVETVRHDTIEEVVDDLEEQHGWELDRVLQNHRVDQMERDDAFDLILEVVRQVTMDEVLEDVVRDQDRRMMMMYHDDDMYDDYLPWDYDDGFYQNGGMILYPGDDVDMVQGGYGYFWGGFGPYRNGFRGPLLHDLGGTSSFGAFEGAGYGGFDGMGDFGYSGVGLMGSAYSNLYYGNDRMLMGRGWGYVPASANLLHFRGRELVFFSPAFV